MIDLPNTASPISFSPQVGRKDDWQNYSILYAGIGIEELPVKTTLPGEATNRLGYGLEFLNTVINPSRIW